MFGFQLIFSDRPCYVWTLEPVIKVAKKRGRPRKSEVAEPAPLPEPPKKKRATQGLIPSVLFMRLRCIFVSITAQKSCRNSLEVVYMPEKLLQHFWDIGSSVSLIFQTFQCWLNSEWSLNFFPKLQPRWKQKLLVWTPLCLCLCFSSTTVSLCPFILLRYYVVVFITLEELRVMFKKSYASLALKACYIFLLEVQIACRQN